MGGGQYQWDRRSRLIQPEAKTNRAGVGPGPKAGGQDPQDRRQGQFRNQHKPKNQKTRKPTQPRQIPRPHTVVLGQHVGLLVVWFSGFRTPFVSWAGVRTNGTGGQGQYSLKPKPTGLVWGQGQKLGARIHRTADRANSETNINQQNKRKQPNLDKFQDHTLSSWDNTLFF